MLQATRLAAVLPSLGRCPTLGDEPLTEGELVLHTLARLVHRLGGRWSGVGLRLRLSCRFGLWLRCGFGGCSCWRLSGFSSCSCCCSCRGSRSSSFLFLLLLLAPVAVAEVHSKIGDHEVPVNGIGGGAGEVRVPPAGPRHHRFLNKYKHYIMCNLKHIILTECMLVCIPVADGCRCSHRGRPAGFSAWWPPTSAGLGGRGEQGRTRAWRSVWGDHTFTILSQFSVKVWADLSPNRRAWNCLPMMQENVGPT